MRIPGGKEACKLTTSVQVQFPASNSLAAPDSFRAAISANLASAFQSDATFYPTYGPATVVATAASEGFILATNPNPEVSILPQNLGTLTPWEAAPMIAHAGSQWRLPPHFIDKLQQGSGAHCWDAAL